MAACGGSGGRSHADRSGDAAAEPETLEVPPRLVRGGGHCL
jgi:hypothetical protein